MDALDVYTLLILALVSLMMCGIGLVVESIDRHRTQKRLHNHIWGDVVDLKSWRNSKKRASGLKFW